MSGALHHVGAYRIAYFEVELDKESMRRAIDSRSHGAENDIFAYQG